MREGKYIVVDNGLQTYAIIFPGFLDHSTVAQQFRGSNNVRIISAGSLTVGRLGKQVGVSCYGGSTTLGMKSLSMDKDIVARTIGLIVD